MKTGRKTFARRAAAIGSATLLSAGLAIAESPDGPVVLICDDAVVGLCDALAGQIDAAAKAHPVEIVPADEPLPEPHHLSLRFVVDTHTPSVLVGHLVWSAGDASRSGAGPKLEVNVSDSKLNLRIVEEYAALLLRESDLPL